MTATLRALFAHSIDYAGLFPPARLPLPDALRNYAAYQTGPPSWLLARFVCPADQLAELARLGTTLPRLRVAVLGSPARSPADFLGALAADLNAVERFRSGCPGAVLDVLEVAFPSGAARVLADAADLLSSARLHAFFEVPRGERWRTDLREACAVLSGRAPGEEHGLKVRCGGVRPEAFPRDDELADFITSARDAGLPWKATAGLHHLHRKEDAMLGVRMHGLCNVFVAALLARSEQLLIAQLVAILADAEGQGFWFDDGRCGWQQWSASLAQIEELRERWLPSFGSCSVEEPFAEIAEKNSAAT